MIQRRNNLCYETFVREHLKAEQPVIVTDAVTSWKAVGKWTPEFFASEFGDRQLPMLNSERTSVKSLIAQIDEATELDPAPYYTGTGIGKYLLDIFPELATDIEPMPEYLSPNWLKDRFWPASVTERMNRGPRAEIFIGGCGSGFHCLHWDSLYFMVFAFQIYGEKEWTIFAPEDGCKLYPKPAAENISSIENLENPNLRRFPDFASATPQTFVLQAGEMLFLPPGWWHTTKMYGPSISVSVNTANTINWWRLTKSYIQDWPMHKALILGASLTASRILKSLRGVA